MFKLRALVYLKRISESLASIAHSLRAQTQIAESDWAAKHAPRPEVKASFSSFDPDAASKQWDERQANRA